MPETPHRADLLPIDQLRDHLSDAKPVDLADLYSPAAHDDY